MARTAKLAVEGYLVACARTGDRTARDELVGRYQKRFLRHAYRLLGEVEPARDAVQEGWLDILRGLPRLRDDGAFRVWAFRIITRKCARRIAGWQRTRAAMETLSHESNPGGSDAEAIERAADRGPLQQALAGLPVEQRTAVALFYLEDMTVAEVAVALEIPVGTVKTRLLSARRKLRRALEGEENGQPG